MSDLLNTGHGHVRRRPDGVLARCGGPALCKDCARELLEWWTAVSKGNAALVEVLHRIDAERLRVVVGGIEYDVPIPVGRELEQQRDRIVDLRIANGAKAAEIQRLSLLINTPETENFLEGVKREAAHQRERWGAPHDREKSAEHWYWLVGYLAGKALRAAIAGDKVKAQHHTISSAAALLHWHTAISQDTTGAGRGRDADLQAHDDGQQAHETASVRAPDA
jgi:hypothetical protein